MALILKRRGIERVRPLGGGYRAWREAGYPTETRQRIPTAVDAEQRG